MTLRERAIEAMAGAICEQCCPECNQDGECASGCRQTADFYGTLKDNATAALDALQALYRAEGIKALAREADYPQKRAYWATVIDDAGHERPSLKWRAMHDAGECLLGKPAE